MNLYTLTLRNILNKKLRVSITLLGVSISIAAFVALVGLADNFKETLKTTYSSRETDLIVLEKGSTDIFLSTIDEHYMRNIADIPAVRDIAAIHIALCAVDVSQYVLVYGWNPESYLFDELRIHGARPRNRDEAILGHMAAKRLNKKTGDDLVIRGVRFRVVGVFMSKSIFEEGSMIILLRTLQEMRGSQGKVTMYNVRLKRELHKKTDHEHERNMVEGVQAQIAQLSPDLDVRNIQSFVSSDNPLFAAANFSWAISTCAFIIAVLGILNTMTTSVLERIKEIGVLLAIGWRRSRIIMLILLEAVTLSLLGGILGILVGYGFMWVLVSTSYLEGILRVNINPMFVLRAISISFVIGILSGIYPALKASSIEPIKILRYE